MDEHDVLDSLLGMGVGQVLRFGPAKVFRDERASWLVAGAGVAKAFGIASFAARWIVLLQPEAFSEVKMMKQEAGVKTQGFVDDQMKYAALNNLALARRVKMLIRAGVNEQSRRHLDGIIHDLETNNLKVAMDSMRILRDMEPRLLTGGEGDALQGILADVFMLDVVGPRGFVDQDKFVQYAFLPEVEESFGVGDIVFLGGQRWIVVGFSGGGRVVIGPIAGQGQQVQQIVSPFALTLVRRREFSGDRGDPDPQRYDDMAALADKINAHLTSGGVVQVTTMTRSVMYDRRNAGDFRVDGRGDLVVRRGRGEDALSMGARLLVGIRFGRQATFDEVASAPRATYAIEVGRTPLEGLVEILSPVTLFNLSVSAAGALLRQLSSAASGLLNTLAAEVKAGIQSQARAVLAALKNTEIAQRMTEFGIVLSEDGRMVTYAELFTGQQIAEEAASQVRAEFGSEADIADRMVSAQARFADDFLHRNAAVAAGDPHRANRELTELIRGRMVKAVQRDRAQRVKGTVRALGASFDDQDPLVAFHQQQRQAMARMARVPPVRG